MKAGAEGGRRENGKESPTARLTLHMGNKNYSSWSLRAWLALRSTGAPFREEVFDLTAPGVRSTVRRSSPGKGRADGVQEDIDRIVALWRECRSGRGRGGEFLFGDFGLADCMFAPVVSRFRTYAVELDTVSREYGGAIWTLPDMREWRGAAEAEDATNPAYDI